VSTFAVAFAPATAAAVAVVVVLGCDRAEPEIGGREPAPREAEVVLAPGYGPLGFPVPEPGSYTLPPLGDAGDGRLLASDGSAVALHDLLAEKVTILSLMYASCSDVNGCPLATAVLHQIARRMHDDPELASGLRLLSLSFDPLRDTPEVMAREASIHARHGVDWQFLTTASEAHLRPILEAYGQPLVRAYDDDGQELGEISHLLRVFLIDSSKRIRNIYSVSYLHADTLVADVKTLLLESASRESDEFPTRTSATTSEPTGGPSWPVEPMDLLQRMREGQLGLPPVPIPPDNPLTAEKVELGRKLFFDRRLSLNATLSCAMCHVPDQGFASNELATAVGIEGRTVRRNAPTILNAAYPTRLFHDGREHSLEHQVWGPLLARNEMGNPSVGSVVERIRRIDDYASRFEKAFPGRGLAIETLGMAIASYERTLLAGDSDFDRWYFGKIEDALDAEAQRGFALFSGKAGCIGCHPVAETHALFSDDRLHDTGIGYRASMLEGGPERRLRIAPDRFVSVDARLIEQVSEPVPDDLGLYEVTQDPDDRWKYRTPSLRNVALTPPYMHDGSLATLRDVVEYYDAGGVPHELLDPRIRRLELSEVEKARLVLFLESLTGGDVGRLVADAHAAPVGDLGAADAAHENAADGSSAAAGLSTSGRSGVIMPSSPPR